MAKKATYIRYDHTWMSDEGYLWDNFGPTYKETDAYAHAELDYIKKHDNVVKIEKWQKQGRFGEWELVWCEYPKGEYTIIQGKIEFNK